MIRSEDLKLKISIKTFLLQINFQPMNKKKLVKLGGGFPTIKKIIPFRILCVTLCLALV